MDFGSQMVGALAVIGKISNVLGLASSLVQVCLFDQTKTDTRV